jgi:hypothetical protein
LALEARLIRSSRDFVVSIEGKPVEVSDVFYTDDADANWSLIYMSSVSGVLWAPVVEKACADVLGGYDKFQNNKTTVNRFWKMLLNKDPDPGSFSVDDQTDLKKILDAAADAVTTPTIGASRTDASKVPGHHGLVIMGKTGNNIDLFDQARGQQTTLSAQDFRKNFLAIFYGKP